MSQEAIKILKLFNEKAERLDQLSFTKFVRETPIGFSISVKKGEPVQFEGRGPSAEATDAFVLTLRYFVQDNEPISIRKVGEIYETAAISSQLKDQYREARTLINQALDEFSMVELKGERLTNRRVFEVFLYGGLAHANPSKKDEFDRWASEPILFGIIQMVFHNIVVELLSFILWAREHNLLAIRELENAVPPV